MRSVLNAVAALVVSAPLLGVIGLGYGTIPTLGPALDPGRGASDLFLPLGYVHAKFRLSEIDLERRLRKGRLAQLARPTYLSSDEFELRPATCHTERDPQYPDSNAWAATNPRGGQ